jgi:hypothetical protein
LPNTAASNRRIKVGQQFCPDQCRAGIDQQEQSKAERQYEQQIAVVLRDRVVDDDLHIEWARQHIELQYQREEEGLDQRRGEPGDPAEEIEQRELGRGGLPPEIAVGGQFQRDAGEMLRHLSKAVPPGAKGGVVNRDPLAADTAQISRSTAEPH